jgi:hypothetical protein
VSINNDARHYVYTPMHTISIKSRPTMKVRIHNQCSDFKLTNKYCFSRGATWNVRSDAEVGPGNTTITDLIPSMTTFKGVLTYKLQRKHMKSDDQSESLHVRLFIAWKFEGYKKLRVFAHLTEYEKKLTGRDSWREWDITKLEEYHQRYINQFSIYTEPIKDTWLINDGTVLMTRLELGFTRRDSVLNITVSEGIRDGYTRKSIWIDPKR